MRLERHVGTVIFVKCVGLFAYKKINTIVPCFDVTFANTQ